MSPNFGNDDGLDLADSSLGRRASAAAYVWDDCTLAAEVHRARSLLKTSPPRHIPTLPRSFEVDHVPRGRRLDDARVLYDTPDQPVATRPWGFETPRSWWPLAIVGLVAAVVGSWFARMPSTSSVETWQPTGQLGVPVMLLGLFALVAGMMLQLKSMRRDNQAALDRMRLVELRLREYRQATVLVDRDHKTDGGIAGFTKFH
jgi:hypothetical protein